MGDVYWLRVSWKKAKGIETKTWHQSTKLLTIEHGRVNRCSPRGWISRYYRIQYFKDFG